MLLYVQAAIGKLCNYIIHGRRNQERSLVHFKIEVEHQSTRTTLQVPRFEFGLLPDTQVLNAALAQCGSKTP